MRTHPPLLPRPPPWRAPVVTPASGQHRSAPAPKSPIDSPPRPLRSRRCPPCRQFTPIFGEIYKELKSRGKNFEVVFASSDRDEASFAEYHGEQPWLAMPFANRDLKNKLSAKYKVQGIPCLILFRDGVELARHEGAVARPQLQAFLDAHL